MNNMIEQIDWHLDQIFKIVENNSNPEITENVRINIYSIQSMLKELHKSIL